MFILGVIVGLAAGALLAWLMNQKQRDQLASTERTNSSQFRRILALEKELADARADGVAGVRDEKLRNAREFRQYKTLLRRADAALAQAKADRHMQDLNQAA